jgi:hypothetical protein
MTAAAIKEKSQALAAAAMKMGEEIYAKGQAPEAGPDGRRAPQGPAAATMWSMPTSRKSKTTRKAPDYWADLLMMR